MKAKETEKAVLVKVPEANLLYLVASKLKDRIFFPEKNEAAERYLQKATIVKS